MPPLSEASLWDHIVSGGHLAKRFLSSRDRRVALEELPGGITLTPLDDFADRSVLIATKQQLDAALALIELDGTARRVVLCPPDVSVKHIPAIAATAEIDLVVTDGTAQEMSWPAHIRQVRCSPI